MKKMMPHPTLRKPSMYFIPEGISGSNVTSKKGWKMNTLDGFMLELGLKDVSPFYDFGIFQKGGYW